MTFSDYTAYFEHIVRKQPEEQAPPYNEPAYIDYTKLNWSRMNRWLKTGRLTEGLTAAVARIRTPQQWLIITEPWCGDAAHNVPFLQLAAGLNPLISISYELRDSEPFSINSYLTEGGKSIPKLVIRDAGGRDLATWGPRPVGCQQVYATLTARQADFEQVKHEIQTWYNADKGAGLQQELEALLNTI